MSFTTARECSAIFAIARHDPSWPCKTSAYHFVLGAYSNSRVTLKVSKIGKLCIFRTYPNGNRSLSPLSSFVCDDAICFKLFVQARHFQELSGSKTSDTAWNL